MRQTLKGNNFFFISVEKEILVNIFNWKNSYFRIVIFFTCDCPYTNDIVKQCFCITYVTLEYHQKQIKKNTVIRALTSRFSHYYSYLLLQIYF